MLCITALRTRLPNQIWRQTITLGALPSAAMRLLLMAAQMPLLLLAAPMVTPPQLLAG